MARLLMQNVSADYAASRAARMLALTTALSEVDTVTDAADVILGLGLDVVEAVCGVIGCADGGQLRILRASGYDTATESRVLSATMSDPTPLSASMRLGKPVYLSSMQEYEAQYPWDYSRAGVPSVAQAHAALPLIHRGVVVGCLGLSFARPTVFGDGEQGLAILLAQTAAAALARARQFDAERASRRECELLARTRGEVLGVVAHDLRNPLNLIQITSEMLLDRELPVPMREQMLQRSIRATHQMNRLIEDLLDATQIEGGKLRLALARVDLKELMSQVNDTFRPLAEEQRIEFEVSTSDAPVSACLDASRVLQAVGNLVGNALKFTPRDGRVTVRASVAACDLVIAVSDTGPGIPPDAVARVFDSFWQATSDRRGIGLGLAIAKGIAEAHGGRIDVETMQGKGSTFRLALPLARTVARVA